MPSSAIVLSAPVFDPDDQDREQLEICHELTRFHRDVMARRSRRISAYLNEPCLISASITGPEMPLSARIEALPDMMPVTTSFVECISGRRSAPRNACGGSVDDLHLATLLKLAGGTTRDVPIAQMPGAIRHFRTYPSAGALYPCAIFVLRRGRAASLYDPVRHVLREVTDVEADFTALEARDGEAPAVTFVIAADLSVIEDKYGPRGYRFALLEAGAISQNLCLAATALGLTSLTYGSYFDAEVEKVLHLDGLSKVVLSVVLIGNPTPQEGSEK